MGRKCRMKKMICEIERRRSLCRLSGCLRPSQKQRKRRSLANNCCGPARQLEQIIARRIADAARRNGASGTSDMHGNAARVVESEPGGERMNLSRNAAIRFASLRRPLTGLNCSSTQRLSEQKHFQLFDRNATN